MISHHSLLIFIISEITLATIISSVQSFSPLVGTCRNGLISSSVYVNNVENTRSSKSALYESSNKPTKSTGDPLRGGKRPSLHPISINAISAGLLLRAKAQLNLPDHEPKTDLLQSSDEYNVSPLDVAMSAGKIATEAIDKRQAATRKDMEENDITNDAMLLKEEECQVIAGRIIGVITRFSSMEEALIKQVTSVGWVQKYGEWDSFGLLQQELAESENSDDQTQLIADRIQIDPLFRMNRAECLLALFLLQVEIPKLQILDEQVEGGSQVDFMDEDRLEVLSSFD